VTESTQAIGAASTARLRWRAPPKWWLQAGITGLVLLCVLAESLGPWFWLLGTLCVLSGAAMATTVLVTPSAVESKSTFAAGWRVEAADSAGYFVENADGGKLIGSRVVLVLRRDIDGHSTRGIELSGTDKQVRARVAVLTDALSNAGFSSLNERSPDRNQ